MTSNEHVVISKCRRCGTCCRKGGPGLHLQDKSLVESGSLALKDLVTYRKGEPVFDNVAGRISPAASDIIRIKSRHKNDAACIFYDDRQGCTIYAHRPLECRVLECWNTIPLQACYNRDRLNRGDLLTDIPWLHELVTDHQQRCGYDDVRMLARNIKQGVEAGDAEKELIEMIRYDFSIRQLVLQKTGIKEPVQLFLFGRPLHQTLNLFGLRLSRTAGGQLVVSF